MLRQTNFTRLSRKTEKLSKTLGLWNFIKRKKFFVIKIIPKNHETDIKNKFLH